MDDFLFLTYPWMHYYMLAPPWTYDQDSFFQVDKVGLYSYG